VLPDCDTYFTPEAGVTSYGLTHVLSLDTSAPGTAVGGVTILGSTSTVYSSAAQLVLAQPDYRYDFGFMPDQRTLLHVFDLDGASTGYKASGSVTGLLPQNNPQFAIDATDDGVVRVGTTGARRANPTASFSSPDFWTTTTDNRVRALAVKGDKLVVAGESASLGHAGESLQSMRFVGDRAYAVTFRNTDPLIVLDVADAAAIRVLGEIEIPGFSQYMHPLDPDHLITFGQDGSGGSQLQLFDVSHPERAIPAPKVLGFGIGSSSAVAYDHKAFTYFAEQQLIALPVYGYYWDATYNRQAFASGLQVIHVDANAGFALRGTVDHAHLYAQQGCGVCDAYGCYDYACYYASPEVRRGHFVSSDAGTFVYGFSYAGVTATDLSTFEDVAKLTLPTPDFGGYYGGGYYGGGGIAVPPVYVSPPVAVDGPPPTRVDAGVAVVDGGVVTTTDGGVANGG